VLSGELASALSWRAAFFVLAVPSLGLAVALWRLLPEPARGGSDRLERGATELRSARGRVAAPVQAREPERDEHEKTVVQRRVDEQNVPPDPKLVLRADPTRMTLWKAARYVLRVRTNVILIFASAFGYFYFTGVQTFGLVLFSGRYGVSGAAATLLIGLLGIGALIGVVVGGRLADGLVERGKVNGRIIVGGVSFMLAAAAFLVALISHSLVVSVPFYIAAGCASQRGTRLSTPRDSTSCTTRCGGERRRCAPCCVGSWSRRRRCSSACWPTRWPPPASTRRYGMASTRPRACRGSTRLSCGC
jgi:MFS family permease